MSNKPKIEIVPIEKLLPNTANHNKGSLRGSQAISASVQKYGLHRGIAVAGNNEAIAGSHILQQAVDAGFKRAVVVETEGDTLVVTRRKDFESAQDPKAIAAAIADNRTNQLNFVLDPEQFAFDLAALEASGEEMPLQIYTADEIEKVFQGVEDTTGEEEDGEPLDFEKDGYGGSFDGDRYALAIVLSSKEFAAWKRIKEGLNLKKDKAAFLQVAGIEAERDADYA